MSTTDAAFEAALNDAARIIAFSNYVVALVGAGISVESGIPPFRGPGGIWTKLGEPVANGYQRFMEDPAAWWTERLAARDELSEFMKALDDAQAERRPRRHGGDGEGRLSPAHHHPEHRQPPPGSRQRGDHGDPRQPAQAALHRVRRPLSPEGLLAGRGAAALPAVSGNRQDGHRHVRRADSDGRPPVLPLPHPALRLHAPRRHVGGRSIPRPSSRYSPPAPAPP